MCEHTPVATMTLSRSLRAPAHARQFVLRNACSRHAGSAEAVLELLVSELVTNAVLHGEPPIRLEIECSVHEIRVAVHDADVSKPVRLSDHGLGLLIVDKIAHAWGTDPTPLGKTVWCTLPSGYLPGQRLGSWPGGAVRGEASDTARTRSVMRAGTPPTRFA
jgi:hypothetical protein